MPWCEKCGDAYLTNWGHQCQRPHDFRPVAGHPDDDECTHRADGTDLTYCARPASDPIHSHDLPSAPVAEQEKP